MVRCRDVFDCATGYNGGSTKRKREVGETGKVGGVCGLQRR